MVPVKVPTIDKLKRTPQKAIDQVMQLKAAFLQKLSHDL
jgi:hypothetical protein